MLHHKPSCFNPLEFKNFFSKPYALPRLKFRVSLYQGLREHEGNQGVLPCRKSTLPASRMRSRKGSRGVRSPMHLSITPGGRVYGPNTPTTASRNLCRSLPQPSNDWKPHAPVTSFQPDVLDRNVWRRPCGGLLLYPGLDADPRRAWPDAGMAGLCAAAAVVRLHGSGLDQLDSLSEIPMSSLTWVAGMVRS